MKNILFFTALSLLFLGCKKEIETPKPTAEFSYIQGSDGFISFINSSINSSSYTWHFGDGNISFEAAPNHTYTENGVYEVTLEASNDDYDYDIITKSIVISSVEEEPVATSGQCLFWTGTPDYGTITVFVDGANVGTITNYSTNGLSPDCGSSGFVTIDRPEGVYSVTASSTSGDNWSFVISITNGMCITKQFG